MFQFTCSLLMAKNIALGMRIKMTAHGCRKLSRFLWNKNRICTTCYVSWNFKERDRAYMPEELR